MDADERGNHRGTKALRGGCAAERQTANGNGRGTTKARRHKGGTAEGEPQMNADGRRLGARHMRAGRGSLWGSDW